MAEEIMMADAATTGGEDEQILQRNRFLQDVQRKIYNRQGTVKIKELLPSMLQEIL